MTEIKREELGLCAELLDLKHTQHGKPLIYAVDRLRYFDPLWYAADREALVKAAKLIVNYADQCVGSRRGKVLLSWREDKDGTYEQCIVKAAAAVMRGRKQA